MASSRSGGGGHRTKARGAARWKAFGTTLAAVVALAAAPSQALRIEYTATDLPDDAGGDLWQYDYRVSETSFDAGFGFSILFAVGTSTGLTSLSTGADVDWDVIVLQPDPLLAADGRYDAQAKIDGATLAFPFSIRFYWSGPGTPGAQAFEIYDPGFATIATGVTAPAPEPGAAALLALGAAGLAARRTRRAA
ncbi:MAG TPA: PEP-CTERM sorting domain-containing protein [Myxococcota bacterium]